MATSGNLISALHHPPPAHEPQNPQKNAGTTRSPEHTENKPLSNSALPGNNPGKPGKQPEATRESGSTPSARTETANRTAENKKTRNEAKKPHGINTLTKIDKPPKATKTHRKATKTPKSLFICVHLWQKVWLSHNKYLYSTELAFPILSVLKWRFWQCRTASQPASLP